jgi:hypothetical protein
LEHGKSLYVAVQRAELIDDILSTIYRCEYEPVPNSKTPFANVPLTSSFDSISCHHSLALLFSVFALGALMDSSKPTYNIEAQEYYYVARAAMSLTPTSEVGTLKSIQTMLHISQYRELSDWEATGSNFAGVLVSVACKSAYTVSRG